MLDPHDDCPGDTPSKADASMMAGNYSHLADSLLLYEIYSDNLEYWERGHFSSYYSKAIQNQYFLF
jgi:hypothetical protein